MEEKKMMKLGWLFVINLIIAITATLVFFGLYWLVYIELGDTVPAVGMGLVGFFVTVWIGSGISHKLNSRIQRMQDFEDYREEIQINRRQPKPHRNNVVEFKKKKNKTVGENK